MRDEIFFCISLLSEIFPEVLFTDIPEITDQFQELFIFTHYVQKLPLANRLVHIRIIGL